MTNPTSQALATRDNGPEAKIQEYRKSFEMVLPSHIKPDAWVRLSQGLLRRDKKLAAVAQKNVGSFMAALLDCARLGLEPGETYHLVPFGNEITGIVDYTGELELMFRTQTVASVTAEVVFQNDTFEYEAGTMRYPKHRPPVNPATGMPDWFNVNRGPIVGAYGYAEMKDGAVSRIVIMDEQAIGKIKAVSKNPGLWTKWPEAMRRKTIVHQLKHWVPSSAEYREQVLRTEAAAGQAARQIGVSLPASDDYGPDIPDPLPSDDDMVDAEIVEGDS